MKEKNYLASSPERFHSFFLLLFFLLISFGISAQTVTGTVSDGEGKAVNGATVLVKGTNKATVTNSSGNFSINAAGKDVLVFSFVGFVTQEIALNGRTTFSVSL